MKTTLCLPPSSALRIFRFDDVDQYRHAATKSLQMEFTPLARHISARQLILDTPGFVILVERSFPRLTDGKLMSGRTAIGFSLVDDLALKINGVDLDVATILLGHGGASYAVREDIPACFAKISFTPEIRDRGWPATGRDFTLFPTSRPAHGRLCLVVKEVLKLASHSVDDLQKPETTQGIKETLLAAADEAFAASTSMLVPSVRTERTMDIIRGIEDVLSASPANPIYSDELARTLGVSVRTLHSAVLRYRGMSLHRYLKIKRLWQVRQRLLVGNTSIKACALAYGFWHLSDFSASYRSHFGELPSETLARAPGGANTVLRERLTTDPQGRIGAK